jgi:hypothetical protein
LDAADLLPVEAELVFAAAGLSSFGALAASSFSGSAFAVSGFSSSASRGSSENGSKTSGSTYASAGAKVAGGSVDALSSGVHDASPANAANDMAAANSRFFPFPIPFPPFGPFSELKFEFTVRNYIAENAVANLGTKHSFEQWRFVV